MLNDNNGNPLTIDQFHELAGTLYAEGSTPSKATWQEAAAIYSVMENRANADGKTALEIAAGGGIYGHSEWKKYNPIKQPHLK